MKTPLHCPARSNDPSAWVAGRRAWPTGGWRRCWRLGFAAALLGVAAGRGAESGVTTKLGFESAYVCYGTKYCENLAIPMVDAFAGDYYAGLWGYLPLDKDGGGYDFDGEWDLFAGRTLKLSDLVSIDAGATVYQYPGVTKDSVTCEGFLWLNLNLPLKPKCKLYYDLTIANWIGEVMVAHSIPLGQRTALAISGHAGFRQPNNQARWYYATAKLDLVVNLGAKAQWSVGVRGTDNTDRAATGHGFRGWYGTALGYAW
jgi:hypothetical protein